MTWGRVVILLVLTSCGRIAFDVRGDANSRCEAAAPFGMSRELQDLNSVGVDGGLRLSDDELIAYFHTDRSGSIAIWSASRDDRTKPFDPPMMVVAELAVWPSPSADGLSIVFNSTFPIDLFTATRTSTQDMFGPGTSLAALNTGTPESSPMLGRTGTTLYFARSDTDGALHLAPWPAADSAAVIVELDGADEEQAPAPSLDDKLIYFGRRDTVSNLDIWRSERNDTASAFESPVIVPGLNSGAEDSPTWLSPDQCRLYFESNRSGDFQLYIAERQP